MLQLNYVVGDIPGNMKKILDGYQEACAKGADLVVAGELALFGYPPKDMLLDKEYLEEQDMRLKLLEPYIGDTGLIIGAAIPNLGTGKPLFNAALLIHNFQTTVVHLKTMLPTYDVFDELRYFKPGPQVNAKEHGETMTFEYKEHAIAVLICEEIWGGSENESGRRMYDYDPIDELSLCLPDIVIAINASPYYWGKANVRYELVSDIAKRLDASIIYVNQVGGNDDLVFDGRSFAVDAKGQCIASSPAFGEAVVIADTESQTPADYPFDEDNIADLYNALVMGTRDYVSKSGFTEGAIVLLSGGIDSAVTAAIAVDVLGADKVIGLSLPCPPYSSPESVEDAEELAKNLGIEFEIIPIDAGYRAMAGILQPHIGWNEPGSIPGDTTEENIQPRLRGMIAMAFSNRRGKIVLSTGNKSEGAVGFCTTHGGDTTGGFGVLKDVRKTLISPQEGDPRKHILTLATYINRDRIIIPLRSITKPPSAELRQGQKDTDSLPPYAILDPIIDAHVEEGQTAAEIIARGYDKETVRGIIGRIHRNEHKRGLMPPGPRVTSKAFGSGRRWPIAAKFKY